MSLVASLLNAILRLDGEALVMHVGEKPYVVAPTGQVELASRPLNFDAVSGMVSQLLPVELQRALDEFGAVQYEVPRDHDFPGEHFSVIAARGGDDVWVEVRRRRVPDDDLVPDELFAPRAPAPPEPVVAPPVAAVAVQEAPVVPEIAAQEIAVPAPPAAEMPAAPPFEPAAMDSDLSVPEAHHLWPEEGEEGAVVVDQETLTVEVPLEAEPAEAIGEAAEIDLDLGALEPTPAAAMGIEVPAPRPAPPAPVAATIEAVTRPVAPTVVVETRPEPAPAPVAPIASTTTFAAVPPEPRIERPEPQAPVEVPPRRVEPVVPARPARVEAPPVAIEAPPASAVVAPPPVAVEAPGPGAVVAPVPVEAPRPVAVETLPPVVEALPPSATVAPPPPSAAVAPPPPVVEAPPPLAVVTGFVRPEPPQPAVVLPITRSPIRSEAPPPIARAATGLDRLLRLAAARAASALYLTSDACPSVRVDGEIQQLSGEAPLSPGDVESLLIDLMPERNREELRRGIATEWICDVADVGRVRCMTFRDHRGAGGIFRMMPVRAISADQLGLSREIQALAAEPEGLVLVAGPRASGKSTLVSAFVDLINRTRRDHVITIESEIKIVHDQRSSLVSQREVRGSADEMLAVVRGAIRENPDVLVFEDLRSSEMMTVALEAAGAGQLVIGAIPAHTATAAIDRIIDLYPPEQRRQVQIALAEALRGVVMQVLVRKPAGGRVAAREVLLNTPAVASAIAEGKTSQLPVAMEGGRKYGMVPLNDALAGLVQNGSVDVREAYRRAADRAGFLSVLKRLGLDSGLAQLPFADGTNHS